VTFIKIAIVEFGNLQTPARKVLEKALEYAEKARG